MFSRLRILFTLIFEAMVGASGIEILKLRQAEINRVGSFPPSLDLLKRNPVYSALRSRHSYLISPRFRAAECKPSYAARSIQEETIKKVLDKRRGHYTILL